MQKHADLEADTPRCPDRGELDALLVRIAGGDRIAFSQFYKATSPKVFAMLVRVMKDRDAASDALQQAYLAIWQKASAYDPARGPAMAWIFVIARHKGLDAMRSAATRRETDLIDERVTDDSLRAEDGATALLLGRQLAKALAGLPDDMARAVRLSAVYGFTSQEIADQFGLPHNTVKSWVRRGLQRLRADVPWNSLSEAI